MRIQHTKITKTTITPAGDKAALYIQAVIEPRGAAIVLKSDAGAQHGAHVTLRVDRAAQALAYVELFTAVYEVLRQEESAAVNLSQLAMREIEALTKE